MPAARVRRAAGLSRLLPGRANDGLIAESRGGPENSATGTELTQEAVPDMRTNVRYPHDANIEHGIEGGDLIRRFELVRADHRRLPGNLSLTHGACSLTRWRTGRLLVWHLTHSIED